jgi:DNA recombination protein RmuC
MVFTIPILTILLVAAVLVVILLKKPKDNAQSMLLLQQQMDAVRNQLAESLKANTETVNKQLIGIIEQVNNQLNSVATRMVSAQNNMNERLDKATGVVSEVQKSLGSLSQATERVFEVGKDISSLQEILRAPKLRGGLGELFLGDLLLQILPQANYSIQYRFKSGETVDAVIKLGSGLVPVDSKFPLENFKRYIECQDELDKKALRRKFYSDVKKHVDAIASKYIVPDEGTFDFALMYIPAENVYYETIIKDENQDEASISTYALSKRIIPVSPNSFYAYLQAILLGLKGLKIEKSAEEIIRHLARLKNEFAKFRDDFDLVGKHMTNLKTKYDDSSRQLEKLGDKLVSVDSDELPLIEK